MTGALSPAPNGGRKSPFAFLRRPGVSEDGLVKDHQWGSTHGSDADGVTGDMIWNESIADALGYGKKWVLYAAACRFQVAWGGWDLGLRREGAKVRVLQRGLSVRTPPEDAGSSTTPKPRTRTHRATTGAPPPPSSGGSPWLPPSPAWAASSPGPPMW